MAEFEPVLLELPSVTPSLAIEVLPHGLTVHRVIAQVDGRAHDLVVGPELPSDHVTQKYTNTIVGRYANRIPVGTHEVERNGITSELTALANESEKVSLHGGPVGFDLLPWTHLTAETPTLFSAAELAHLDSPSSTHAIFRLISPDRDQGFPGKLVVEALVALISPEKTEGTPTELNLGSILLVYRAKLDEGEKKVVTPINLTQHWGFNLEASLKETPEPASVKEHRLMIKADRYAILDSDSLYAGFLQTADYPEHNHNSGKLIGEDSPKRGYDDFYFLPNTGARHIPTRFLVTSLTPEFDLIKDIIQPLGAQGRGKRPASVAELHSDKTGISLMFDTNQHGVMFYTNIGASADKGARKKIHGGSGISGYGDSYGPGTAAFLEFHDPLAAFLDPLNKNDEDTLLTTEEIYHNYVRCDILLQPAV